MIQSNQAQPLTQVLEQTDRLKIKAAIFQSANKYELSPHLIAAIILQESSCDPFAIRYEPNFYQKYCEGKLRAQLIGHVPLSVPTFETELKLRACSWGLMQVMGQVARERGFIQNYLTTLLTIEINIDIGCGFLKWCFKNGGNTKSALLRWNGGANKKYPSQVLTRIDNGQTSDLIR